MLDAAIGKRGVGAGSLDGANRRLLVVSHACVIDANQAVYLELRDRGWDVRIVVPSAWRHDYAARAVRPKPLKGLEDALLPLPVVLSSEPQRHAYLASPSRLLNDLRPDILFVEEESFSVPAVQWGIAAHRSRPRVRWGVQGFENLDRPLPLPARLIRRWVLANANFVVARSPAAAGRARAWGAQGQVGVAPPAIPWGAPRPPRREGGPFTVGFAGRLVPEKGVHDLASAVAMLRLPVRLLVAGQGPLIGVLEALREKDVEVEILGGVAHYAMSEVFARMDVLAVPSRTTPTWAEQFGRVLVEAMAHRVPVVAFDSGEIPWVIKTTDGGIIVPEGEVHSLAEALERLRRDQVLRADLGERGAAAARRLFSTPAAADQLEQVLSGTRLWQPNARVSVRSQK